MAKTCDVVVIGGGVIGCAISYYLAKKGKEIILIEKNDIASGASGACDIDIILQSKSPGAHLELAMRSAQIYEELEKELGQDLEYNKCGGMILIENKEELQIMKELVKRQKSIGLDVELLCRNEAEKIQPGLASHLLGATYSSQDAHVNPMKVALSYAKAASKYNTEIFLETRVENITIKNGSVKSVVTDKGEIYTDTVVNAAGAYAASICEMVEIDVPIKPRRGQIVVTEAAPKIISGDTLSAKYIAAKYNPKILRKDDIETVLGVGLSLSQTKTGNILIGATREFVGFDKRTTYIGLKAILQNATRLVPILKKLNIIRTFAGLRPYTPDGLPILGQIPQIEGFIMAAGHEGDGIALAPITGKIISDFIAEGKADMDLSCFSIERFI